MYKYRVSFKHHLLNAWPILIHLISFSLIPYYMVFKHGNKDILFFIIGSAGLFFLVFIPQLILHLNYLKHNHGDVFEILPDKKLLRILKNGQLTSFTYQEIKKVYRFKSFPLAEKRMQWFPWDGYNYSIIILYGGKKLCITSLLVPNLDLPIDSEKIILHKRFYPMIDFNYV